MMGQFDRLFTLWRDSVDGTRHVVGELWFEGGAYHFAYADDLEAPEKCGFQELSEFPERRGRERPYRTPHLFPTFAQRIPDPRRIDRAKILASWGVENADDRMEILARSGGVQVTDRIELAEFRAQDDDLSQPLEFRVSGMRHQEGANRVSLQSGDRVTLRRQHGNIYDRCATLVLVRDNVTVGYVPRQYSALVSRLLDERQPLDAEIVRKLLLPEETGRWVVRLVRATAVTSSIV